MLKFLTRMALVVLVALAAALPASAAYRIQAGDRLNLQVVEDSSLNRSLLVLPDGSVTVPSVGSIRAAGLSVDALRNTIAKRLAPGFSTTPTVYLSVAALKPVDPNAPTSGPVMEVYALGEVAKPGMVAVSSGSTLLQALAQAGGPTPYAATKRIQLRRTYKDGQARIFTFNYKAAMQGKAVPSIRLQKGDVIMVPTRRLFE